MTGTQSTGRTRGPGRLTAKETALLRDRILESAEAIFVEQGYGRATMEQIAQSAGIGRKTLYARFTNKAEVLEAVVNRLLDSAMAPIPTPARAVRGDARSHLLKMARALADLSASPHVAGINRLIFGEALQAPNLAALFVQLHGRAVDEVQAKLEGLHKQGALPALSNSRAAAAIFIEMAASVPRLRALVGTPLTRKETDELSAAAVDIFLHGCVGEGAAKGRE